MKHNLKRTNPKGIPGIFRCLNCGAEGPFTDFLKWDCPQAGDQDEELISAIKGEQ